jgi:prepilin-type N-terminal cleavage/methylation domain-containing protein
MGRVEVGVRIMPRLPRTAKGFTLIELIAVLAIISMMLFFSIPRVGHDLQSGDVYSVARWIMLNVRALKSRAADERQMIILNVELDANALSITDEKSTENEEKAPEAKKYQLPSGIQLIDVEYPGKGLVTAGKTPINFYGKGYSDKAVIHIRDKDNAVFSFLIEPFLPVVEMVEERVSFGG